MTIEFTKSQINAITAAMDESDINAIESCLLFVGHAHSGHSIIGAILDAHPKVAIANEVNIVKAVNQFTLKPKEILAVLLNKSVQKKATKDWLNSEYKHAIKNSHQGLTSRPLVVGDKKAGGTTRIIHHNPQVYDYLLDIFKTKLSVIFVRRKPIDIVAAYAYYMKQKPSQFHIDRYIENMETVRTIKKITPPEQWLTINQSHFVNQPTVEITRAFNFLNLNVEAEQVAQWTQHVDSNIKSKSTFIDVPDFLFKQLSPYNFED